MQPSRQLLSRASLPSLLVAAALLACGGPADPAANPSSPTAAAGAQPPGGASSGTVPADGPPGTPGFSSNSGHAAIQVAAGSGLYFIDHPAAGEASMRGLVLVTGTGTTKPLGAPPADTVVTLDGVPLVHAVVNGAASDRFFEVDPAGPQPTIAPDGYLHITASSASTGVTRTLNLACPFDMAVTTSPAPGASLAGTAALHLSWTADLPHQPVGAALPNFSGPALTLLAFDPAAKALGASIRSVFVDQGAHAADVVVSAAPQGYLAELSWPAVYYIDGQTGGFCARTKRIAFAP